MIWMILSMIGLTWIGVYWRYKIAHWLYDDGPSEPPHMRRRKR